MKINAVFLALRLPDLHPRLYSEKKAFSTFFIFHQNNFVYSENYQLEIQGI